MRQQAIPPGTRCVAQAVAALALLAHAAPGYAAPGWDIVGIRLGMTEQEARAAIGAHSAQARITDRTLKFTYSDGAKQHETPAFLATIEAAARTPGTTLDGERVKLEFSPPPLEQRVIGVRREVTTYHDPPARERMLASLSQKYGKPLNYATYNIGGTEGVADWAETGKPVCGQRGDYSKGMFLPPASQGPGELKKYYQWQQQKLAPADLSTCSARLRANLTVQAGGSSVVSMVFEMTDPGYMLPALEATSKWVSGMEETAKKARLNSGAVPRL